MPASVFFQLRKVRLPISIAGGQLNSSSGLDLAALQARRAPTKTLNVEPGGYAERKARGEQRDIRVVLQRLEVLGGDRRDERVRIERRPRRQREDVAVVRDR